MDSLRRYKFYAAVFALALLALTIKYNLLRSVEPALYDQAAFARWVFEISSAHHLLPQGEGAWISKLEADSDSFVFRFLLPGYNHPFLFLSVIPLLINYFISLLLGYSYPLLVGMGVVAHIGVAWAIGMIAAKSCIKKRSSLTQQLCFLLAFVLVVMCGYLHWFSAIGVHNFGIFATYLSSLALENARGDKKWLRATSAILLLAPFCHWTVVLMLIPTIIIFHGSSFLGERLKSSTEDSRYWLGKLGVMTSQLLMIAVGPALILLFEMFIPRPETHPMFYYLGTITEISRYFFESCQRFVSWFVFAGSHFSAFATILGLLGLGWYTYSSKRIPVIGAILLAHIFLWTVLPGFTMNSNRTALRTFPYVIPSLIVGVCYFVFKTTEVLRHTANRIKFRNAIVISVTGLLISEQVVHLRNPAIYLSEFYNAYLSNVGQLAKAVAEIDAVTRAGHILTWNYETQNKIIAMNPDLKSRLAFSSTLETLLIRVEDGSFFDYLKRRRLVFPGRADILVIMPSEMQSNTIKAWSSICEKLQPECKAIMDETNLPVLKEIESYGWKIMRTVAFNK